MMHRSSPSFVSRLVGVVIPIGLIACSDHADLATPEPDSAAAPTWQAAERLPAVHDAVNRLIPNLSHPEQAAGLDQAFRELAAALVESNEAATIAAYHRARTALERFAQTSSPDNADVDAIRLVLDEAP